MTTPETIVIVGVGLPEPAPRKPYPNSASSVRHGRPTIDHLATMAPLQRLGTPIDIAEVVSFLAGPA